MASELGKIAFVVFCKAVAGATGFGFIWIAVGHGGHWLAIPWGIALVIACFAKDRTLSAHPKGAGGGQ